MSYDLSPMRPDELARTDAERWTEALALRAAIAEGIAAARDEQAAREAVTAELEAAGF